MKKLKQILLGFAIVVCAGTAGAQTQLHSWFAAPDSYNMQAFTTAPWAGVSPNNKYYNSICDNSGALSFYVTRDSVYNSSHVSMGALRGTSGTLFSHTEVAIVPNPGNLTTACQKKYYVIFPYQSSTLNNTMAYGEVNMATGTYTFIASLPVTIGNPVNPMAVSRVNASGHRYLYFPGGGAYYLPILRITSTGITAIPVGDAYTSTILGCNEMELSNAGDKLVFSHMFGGTNNIIVVPLNPATGLPSAAATVHPTGSLGQISGIELDNGGTQCYYSSSSGGVYVRNITAVNTPSLIIATPFDKCMLEKSFNGTEVICASTTQVKGIITASNTIDATWTHNKSLPAAPVGAGPLILMPDQIDGEDYALPVTALVPIISTPTPICQGTAITVDGTASYGTVNGVPVANAITSHVWIISECTSAGVPFGPDFWAPFISGPPTVPYTFPANTGALTISCGKYYLIKLALQNTCVPWAETTKMIFINCNPVADAGPDVNLCKNFCTTIGTNQGIIRSTSYVWTGPTGVVGTTQQISVCPTVTTTYTLTVTKTTTGCFSVDYVTVFVENNDPGFSYSNFTGNPAYYTVSATPNNLVIPPGFGYLWILEDLNASSVPIFTISNPSAWWTFPGITSNVFNGFDPLTYTYSGTITTLASSTTPAQGQFEYFHTYRITRGTWSTLCPWQQSSHTIYVTKNMITGAPEVTVAEDAGAPDMSYMLTGVDAPEGVETSISVYPNPGRDVFTIDLNRSENITSMEVFDATGKLLKIISVEKGQLTYKLDLSNFSKGLYLIKVSEEQRQIIKKIIVE